MVAENKGLGIGNEVWLETGQSMHHWRGHQECGGTESCLGTVGWRALSGKVPVEGVSGVPENSCRLTAVWELAVAESGGQRKGGKETVCSLQRGG